ncbi:MAG: hypothetical protein AAFS13_10555 [Pseudomonadota bacterium]
MAEAVENNVEFEAVLRKWRQGDFALDCGPLIFADAPEIDDADPLTPHYEDGVLGFVVISQTCDIVRSMDNSPMVSVAPLIEVAPQHLEMIARGRAPRFGYVQNAREGIVADFSKTMSVAKGLVASWDRQPGFDDPERAMKFAYALERAFGRFAFPDDFNASIEPLRKAIQKKHGKMKSPLGRALDNLLEIRVLPNGPWTGDEVAVQFLLIFKTEDARTMVPEAIQDEFRKTLNALKWKGGFSLHDPPERIGSYEDYSAREYIDSVPLDLNALSFAERGTA